MKVAILPSTQNTSTGNGIGGAVESTLCQDITARLVPKLRAAGHTVGVFAGQSDANSDGARSAVSWGADIVISIHLDSANGTPAALLCYQESRSLSMGLAILAAYCREMGIRDKGGMLRTPGTNGVAVLRIPEAAGIPAALIECGDMSRPDGPNWLEPAHREKAANALAVAICAVAGGATPQPVKPKEGEESMYYQGPPYASADGKKFEFFDCYQRKFKYVLKTIGSAKNLVFTLIAEDGTTHKTAAQNVDGQHLHFMDILAKQKPITGSFLLSATSDTPIKWGLREEVR